jgi:subtilase family protein/tetratricopeptide repeat protein
MASPEQSAALPQDSEGGGVLLGEGGGITASDLYDPATGNALLVQGVPLDPPPPAPDQVRTGIIDSGVLPDHPQLRNLVVAMKDFAGDNPIDRIGHGTLVAIRLVESHHGHLKQIAAGDPELAAKLAGSPALVSAKVTGPTGKIELEHVVDAVHWMATQGVRVANMSLAFLGRKERYAGLCKAIAQYAQPNNGIMFIAAAGNFGPNVSAYPAACKAPNLVSVGAVIDGQPWAQSGKGSFAAEGRVRVVPAYLYHYEDAQQSARAGAYDHAREGYRASLAAQLNAPALFGLALLDLHAGDIEPACSALTRATQLAPDDAEIEAHLGAARLMQERPAEARTHLDRAIALDPNNVRARTNRSMALVRLGEPARALDDLRAARSIAEDTSRIDAMITDLLRTSGVPLPGTKS